MDAKIKNNKRGQVTIFIIIAILIIAVILLFLLLRGDREPNTGGKPTANPESFLDSCLKDSIRDAINDLGAEGGFMEHNVYLQFKFTDEAEARDIEYLCYQKNYYLPCVNQEPMLFHHLEGQIGDLIEEDIWGCWDSLGKSLEKGGYVVDARRRGFDIVLEENRVFVVIDGTIILTKSGETSKEEKFRVGLSSNLYGLIKITQEIVSSEAYYCDFDYVNYMLVDPEWSIEKFTSGKGTSIYTITHRETNEKFRFAIRGCVSPPGY